jgi:hypothetical protein
LRGFVWTPPRGGGVWLELIDAARCLEAVESAARDGMRLATDALVLAESEGQPPLLCRLRDVGDGGARIAAAAPDVGEPGSSIKITLPEAGPQGQFEAFGRVIWARGGEAGIEWAREDLVSLAAIRRMQEIADDDWQPACASVHPRTCRCQQDQLPTPVVTLA